MKTLKIKSLANNYHFLFLLIILVILSIKYLYLIPLTLIYLYYLIRKIKIHLIFFIPLIILGLSYLQYLGNIPNEFKGLVVDKNNQNYTVLVGFHYVKINTKTDLELGDYGTFVIKDIEFKTPSPFDYNLYLKNKNIKRYANLIKFSKKNNYFVLNKIPDFFINHLQDNEIKPYIKTLIFGQNDLDDNIKDGTKNIGISHLLAISGMHIAILILILNCLLDKLLYYEKKKDIIRLIFLVFYMIITNFSISVSRASLLVILPIIMKKKYPLLTKLDYLSIIGITILILHPKYLFLPSFSFSFLMSFVMISFISELNIKNVIISTFLTSLVMFYIGLPLIMNLNYEINFLTIFISPIFAILFTYILFPVTIIIFFFPISSTIFLPLYKVFEKMVLFFNQIRSFKLITGKPNILIILILIIISYFVLANYKFVKKFFISCLLYGSIFILFIYKPFMIRGVYFIAYNVGQGDSFLLMDEKINILIDVYGNIYDYLKADGIREIDYVILSHGDNDHIGSFKDINDNYHIKETFISNYTVSDELKELDRTYHFTKLKQFDKLSLSSFNMQVIGPDKLYQEENNNSLVINVSVNNRKILLTGDMELKEENNLLNYFSDIDILKVSHHGADTSNSKHFLDITNPTYCLISVGKNNNYGHPNNYYLLNNYLCYQTAKDKIIYLNINKYGKINIRTKLLI